MRKLLVLVLVTMLASCGFHMRGQQKLAFERIAVTPQNFQLTLLLKREIREGGNAQVVDATDKAAYRLEILSEVSDRIILSLDATGQVREYELRYKVAFRLIDPRGEVVLPKGELFLTRLMSYDISEILAKASEANLLYSNMRRDAANQIIRRLAAVRIDENR